MKLAHDISEREWQAQIISLAKQLSWRVYHTFDSRRSAHGFPDLVLVRERTLFVELKSETGKLSPAQAEWLEALTQAGALVYLWRPSHLEEAARILSRRAERQAA